MWIETKDGDLINMDQAKEICISSSRVTASMVEGTSVTLATHDTEKVMAKIVSALNSGVHVLRLDR